MLSFFLLPLVTLLSSVQAASLNLDLSRDLLELRKVEEYKVWRRQQQEAGTPLYLDSPACDFYQCAIYWKRGTMATANWLNAPAGDVVLDLMTNNSADLAYNIATVPGVSSNPADCDNEGNPSNTCGALRFTVPSTWADGNYTMRASSQQNPAIASYTDVILIQSNGTTGDVPFATSGAAATSTFALNGAAPSSGSSDSSSAPVTTTGSSAGSSSASSSGSNSASSSSSTAQATGTTRPDDNGTSKVGSSMVFLIGSVALGMSLLL